MEKESPNLGPIHSLMNSLPKEKLHTGMKRFLVFDHSFGQTNLIYTSKIESPPPPPTPCPKDSFKNKPEIKKQPIFSSDPFLTNDHDEEIHEHEEDSDELDALLYSDDEIEEEEIVEEVASSSGVGSVKRQKLAEYEDDAQSRCGDDERLRERKEKIRETISVLKRMVPGGKGRDGCEVIDEAIDYLLALKVKAKSLGLGGL